MFSNLIDNYGVLLLILIYIGINLYYKKVVNIVLFLVVLVSTYNLFADKSNSLILAYIVSIGYGIIVNFHLLENFQTNKDQETGNDNSKNPNNSKGNNSVNNSANKGVNNSANKGVNNSANHSANQRNLNKQLPNRVPIKKEDVNSVTELLTETMIKKFIEALEENEGIVSRDEYRSNDELYPILSQLQQSKVNSLIDVFKQGRTDVLTKPLIISDDNFIIDGHHIWYAHRKLLEEKENQVNNEVFNKLPENLNVTVINHPIKVVIRLLKTHSIKYKNEILNQFQLDDNVLNDLKEVIKSLDNSKNKLEQFYVKVANAIELV